ncbi:MAG TPA: hypothetical protein VHQ66_11980, partial [Myxococcota bacterium]|nr:hypothetical protein [Myxococcota bacterium]
MTDRLALTAAAALAALLLVAPACQTAKAPSEPKREAAHPFPTPKQLDALGDAAPETLARMEIDDVERWTLSGPFPERVEVVPHAPGGPIEALLDAAVARRAGLAVASEAMHCMARELALFVAQRGKMAPPALVEFSAGRCGALVSVPRTVYVHGAAPAGVPEQELVGVWRAQLESMLEPLLAGGPVDAGLAFARVDGRAAAVAVASARRVQVTPFSPVAADGVVSFAGEALGPVEEVQAGANQGELGHAKCTPDPAVQAPRFSFRCPLARGDESAAIDVMVREQERLLSQSAFSVLARAPGADANEWRRPEHAPSRVAADAADFADAVQAALGAVRKREGLRPLVLSRPQSEVADELAPHVLAPALGAGSPAAADLAALGLVAGWGVGGAVRGAGLATGLVIGALDAGRFVDAALERPSGRASLLDPDARVLAVGTLTSKSPPALAGVAVT